MNSSCSAVAPPGAARLVVGGLLLAAGAGRRMGLPKALVRWEGGLLVERGVALLLSGGCDPVMVVLGARADQVLASAHLAPAKVIVHNGWNEGMGSSLRAGLNALDEGKRRCDAVVVALVDQPLITSDAVRRLIGVWSARSPRPAATVATYAGRPRNPVLLGREAWDPALAAARGDTGARSFLRAGLSDGRVVPVPCDDAGMPDDIDTPEQLATVHAKVEEG
ncbi:MAG: NTP transferase domain-containing protein [Nitriliruptorales bacterium]|nr:NTP transferase domain-containing protein [Nitriliruptorales bacterium]